jgi:predicted ester cyclase
MSSTSKNAAVIREFTRVFKNEHNVDGIDHLFAPEFQHHFRVPLPPGLAGFKAIGRMMNGAFPDVRVTEDLLVVTEDFVVERSSAVATNRGEFMGMKPSGNQVRWFEIHIYRLANAKIVEHWVELSTLELVEQIRAEKPR